jgi:diguanylate cyclase (GGDEF)-like protein
MIEWNRRALILIVDDEPEVLRVVSAMLQPEHDCLTAGSAEEALTVLPAVNAALLISDIHLPGMSGLQLIPRTLAASPATVVMMMSGERDIDNAIGAMRAGAFDYIRKPLEYKHVLAAVRRALDHRALVLAKAHYENHLEDLVRQRTAELERLTCYDPVTGLPNRLLCGDRLALALSVAQSSGHMIGVLSIFIDQLDAVKDALGHSLADEVLREVSRRLASRLREGDTAGRFEGNEFVVILTRIEKADRVAAAVLGIRQCFEAPFTLDGHDLAVTASIGIGLYPDDGQTAAILFHNAHSALCRARELRENSNQFYAPGMDAAMRRRFSLEGEIRRSTERGDFELHYQPQMDVHTWRIVGAEALVRWRRPGGESVSQEDFIRVAEDSGLIVPIGEWVIRTACEQIVSWRRRGFSGLNIAVNLSGRQFRQKDLARTISRVLQETGANADDLELELTESCVVHDLQSSAEMLRELKQLGIRIALDDFGTGYSSLSYLKRLPVDRLKIDRSFIADLATDPDSAALVMAIINLAHNLRLGVIAEGVENAEQLKFLHLFQCDQWQGYLCSQPVPADQFERLLGPSHSR